jgi:hypothetical protein
MDPDALAATAGNALITAMTSDAWHRAVSAVLGLWRRVHPQRLETVEEELAETHQAILSAQKKGDIDSERRLAEEWASRLLRLVQHDESMVAELQKLVEEILIPLATPQASEPRSVVITATSLGGGDIYQAAGQQSIYRA